MKTRKILCIMAALTIAATAAGCNTGTREISGEPSVSSEESSQVSAGADENGELVPKINAKERPKSNDTDDWLFDSFTAKSAVRESADLAGEAVTNAAEAPARTDTAPAIADTAPAPGYIVDEYSDDYYPQTKPQAGLLTAGVWNDNDNWGFFTNLVNNDKITLPTQYGLAPVNRVVVTVTDKSGKPVVNANVNGMTEAGESVWSAVTDKNGIAYLFGGDKIAELDIESQGQSQKQSVTFRQTKNDEQTDMKVQNDEVAVTFDGEGKNYEKNEIMFVVDTTGSMGDELMFLQSEFTAIAEEIGTENTRFSINFYRDEYDDYTTKRYPFSTNIEEINKKLNSESAEGGGDLPEAVAEVLDETINDGGWSEESVKLMFMIFDAPPHDGKAQVLESAVQKAAEKGIRIIPVVSSNSDRDTELFGRGAAIMTGGTYVFLTDDSGIGYSHLEPIVGEYKVEKLYDIIIRIINDYKQVNAAPTPVPQESEVSEISEAEKPEVSEIIDRTVTEQITTDSALEKFYESYGNVYYFGSIKSEYVIVKYADGTTETVVSALKNGKITIADLDKFGIEYIKEPAPV